MSTSRRYEDDPSADYGQGPSMDPYQVATKGFRDGFWGFLKRAQQTPTLYHGTTRERADRILQEGLDPALMERDIYASEAPGGKIYMTSVPEYAESYASMAARWEHLKKLELWRTLFPDVEPPLEIKLPAGHPAQRIFADYGQGPRMDPYKAGDPAVHVDEWISQKKIPPSAISRGKK